MEPRRSVPGVILVTSCHKHLGTRVAEMALLRSDEFEGWPVHAVVGDPSLPREFELRGRLLVVRCEDSYVHLLKKVALAVRALCGALYDVRHGVLRCGDDLEFDAAELRRFLRERERPGDAAHYAGRPVGLPAASERAAPARHDPFMVHYYRGHPEDFRDPLHGLAGREDGFERYSVVPAGAYVSGVMLFLSARACALVVAHMEAVGFDVFAHDPLYGYPYIIEDVGIGHILRRAGVPITPVHGMYDDHGLAPGCIAHHSNRYK